MNHSAPLSKHEAKRLNEALSHANRELTRKGGRAVCLAHPVRVALMVELAQGVIDNGGLQYFFEMDFDGHPPYSMIADAYREIGATNAATTIDEAVDQLFSFSNPETNRQQRNDVLDAQRDDPHSDLEKLTDQICGDEAVWRLLYEYVRNNRSQWPR